MRATASDRACEPLGWAQSLPGLVQDVGRPDCFGP